MKIKYLLIVIALFAVTFTSCKQLYKWNQPKEYEQEYSVTWPISGEWYVTCNFDDGTGAIGDWGGYGYLKLMTYNTSGNSADTVWIDDLGNFWTYKGKVACNVTNKTFGQTDSIQNVSYDIKMLIQNGKIIEDGATCASGVKSDSIYFEVIFADDPTSTTYYIYGYRRTGYLEDEH